MQNKTDSYERLLHDLNDGTKDVFLQPTTAAILREARKNADYNLTRDDIELYRHSLWNISRQIEKRELSGKSRYQSTRRWLVYAPGALTIYCFFQFVSNLKKSIFRHFAKNR